MLGSSNSIACANIMLNSAVASVLRRYADALEGAEDFDAALHALIRGVISAHKRIIFNGNGYDAAWLHEAERRGLSDLRTTPDCMPRLLDKKNIDMLTSLGVYTEAELRSRYEIMLENYCKTVNIEALTMADMAKKDILPAVEAYAAEVAKTAAAKRALDPDCPCAYERGLVRRLSTLCDAIAADTEALEDALQSYEGTLFIVSHDRYLINKIADKVYAIEEEGVSCTLGGYDAYLETVRGKKAAEAAQPQAESARAVEYRARKEQQAALRKEKAALRRLEAEIEQTEAHIAELEAQLGNPAIVSDYEEVARLSRELDEARAVNEEQFARWTELSERLEARGDDEGA